MRRIVAVVPSLRSALALVAAGLTLVAAVVSRLDAKPDETLFFAVLTVIALLVFVLLRPGLSRSGPTAARLIAGLWVVAGAWIGVLLLMYQAACACSRALPAGPLPVDATYLGLTATAYHLIAMYGATALIISAAFGRSAFLDRPLGRSRNVG